MSLTAPFVPVSSAAGCHRQHDTSVVYCRSVMTTPSTEGDLLPNSSKVGVVCTIPLMLVNNAVHLASASAILGVACGEDVEEQVCGVSLPIVLLKDGAVIEDNGALGHCRLFMQ